jgi:hypothetical protein
MQYAAYRDLDDSVIDFDNRHMLFLGGIDRVFRQLFHFLAAADQGRTASVDDFDDIAAMFALVDLKKHRHDGIPPLYVLDRPVSRR